MWGRNLLFVAVVVGTLAALLAPILPARSIVRWSPTTRAASKAEVDGPVGDVDRMLRQSWEEAGVEPAPPADELLVARRLSLALTGRIPSLEEIRWFESQPAGERVSLWRERLLNSRVHADYFGERFARVFVGTDSGPRLAYRRGRFVSWLSDQFSRNLPYDELVRRLLASWGYTTDSPAVNFLMVAYELERDPMHPDPVKLASRVGRSMLGVRLECAECHDHPFAEWKQDQFHALAAFFGQVEQGFARLNEIGDREYKLEDHKTGEVRIIAPQVPFSPEYLSDEGTRRERLAGWVTHPKNPALSKVTVNRMWALLLGRPLVEPIDDLPVGDSQQPILEYLARDFVDHGYDLRRLIRIITDCAAYQRQSGLPGDGDKSRHDAATAVWAAYPITPLRSEQVAASLMRVGSVESQPLTDWFLMRLAWEYRVAEFVGRYSDAGESELDLRPGTIPQRLILLNGELADNLLRPGASSAINQIAVTTPDDAKAVEAAYLTVLARRPTPDELTHFARRVAASSDDRFMGIQDLFAAMINSMEFSWNY